MLKRWNMLCMPIPDDGGDGGDDTFDNMTFDENTDVGNQDESDMTGKKDYEEHNQSEKNMPDRLDNKRESERKESKKSEEKIEESEEEFTDEEIEYFKAKIGDKELDIHPDAMLNIGDEEIPFQEILDRYVSADEYEANLSKFSENRENFESEQRSFRSKIEEANSIKQQYQSMKELAQSDPVGSFFQVLDSLGVKSNNGYDALAEMLFPDIDRAFAELDETEFRTYMLQNKNNFLTKMQDIKESRFAQEEERVRLSQEIFQARSQHGITDAAYKDAYNRIVSARERGADVKLDPSTIAKVALQNYVDKTASELLDSIQKGLSKEPEIMKAVTDIMDEQRFKQGRDFSDEQLQEIREALAEEFGVKVKNNSKISKNAKRNQSIKKGKTASKRVNEDDSFDDIDY